MSPLVGESVGQVRSVMESSSQSLDSAVSSVAQPKTCFVVMPFSDTKDPAIRADQWDDIFEGTFRPAVEAAGYTCYRSPSIPGNFVRGIVESLHAADLVIADLTGNKPNVFYELGVRHALRPGTIIVAQSVDSVPSDLRSYYCLQYDHSTAPKRAEFARKLGDIIATMRNEPTRPDSPVFDYLEIPYEPAVTVRPSPSSFARNPPPDNRTVAAFAHVQVFNSGPHISRARCYIEFHDSEGVPIFSGEMPGRWSGAPEPLSFATLPSSADNPSGARVEFTRLFDSSKLPSGYVADLARKESDTLAIAIKFADGTCWGWTQESYAHNFRHPDWRLPIGLLRVRVRILANGMDIIEDVVLDTRSNLDDFCVRTADTGTAADAIPLTRNTRPGTPSLP